MSEANRVQQLEEQVNQLTKRITRQEDEQAIRKLHHIYGYMIDKCMYNDVVDLFTEDCQVLFFGGIYKGKAGAKRLYVDKFQQIFTNGNNGPVDGQLLDHPQHQDVVNIDDDGVTAHGRFRCTMQAGKHKDFGDPVQWWEGGLYENVYKKVNGVWHLHVLGYFPQWHADFESGWAHTRRNYVPFTDTTLPEDPFGPDELMPRDQLWLWPTHKLLPFHCMHPVTGKPIVADRWQGDLDREAKEKAEK